MLDLSFIRQNKDIVINALIKKNIKVELYENGISRIIDPTAFLDRIIQLDDERKEVLIKIELLRSEKNKISEKIPSSAVEEKQALVKRSKDIKTELVILEPRFDGIIKDLENLILRVPNVPLESVPPGNSDFDNVEIRKWGIPRTFDFRMRDHIELGELLDIIDVPRGVKISGSRNYYLKNEGVLLELAICRYVLDKLIKKGFTPFLVPLLVNDLAMIGTGFFPGGEEQAYRIERDSLNLIGTSEVSLASYNADEIFDETDLPRRYVGYSNCFRREAGTYGKDTHGLYRVHQFQKIEQVILCKNDPNESKKMHEAILNNSEEILKELELPYRVVIVCTGEMGQGQVYKNDIETWMPSRNNYGETHSCSTLYEFQARRLNIRYRDAEGNVRYVHTLNNTAVASPRILIPVLENYQNEDGSVRVPKVLIPYMNGMEVIFPKGKN